MQKALHSMDNIDRLCGKGGRGLASIDDCVDEAMQRLKNISKNKSNDI